MARAEITLRASSSDGLQFRLMSGINPINLTGLGSVQLRLRDRNGGVTVTDNVTGKLTVNGAAGGSVLWTPGTADLVAGSAPYTAFFRCFVSATAWYHVPEDSEVQIDVREAF